MMEIECNLKLAKTLIVVYSLFENSLLISISCLTKLEHLVLIWVSLTEKSQNLHDSSFK